MRTGRAGRRPRRFLRTWHLWFGLLVGPWLALLALTGSAIAFYDELDDLLNPDWRMVASDEGTFHFGAVDRALEAAGGALPGFTPRLIDLPNAPGETIRTVGSAMLGGEEPVGVQLFSHPATGAVLGWRRTEAIAFDRRHLVDALWALHTELLAGPTIGWLLGFVALFWLIDHLPAAILAVPRLRAFGSALRIGGKAGGLRRLYDLHRAPGLWLFPMTAMLALTGLCLSWPDESRAVMNRFSPVSERLHYEMPDAAPSGSSLSPSAALAAFTRKSNARIDSILPLPGKGLYAIRSFDARDPDDLGRLWTYVAMTDGRVMARRHDMGSGAGDSFFGWQYPLHSGRALGLPGRTLIAATGLAIAAIWATGLILWWKRRASNRPPR